MTTAEAVFSKPVDFSLAIPHEGMLNLTHGLARQTKDEDTTAVRWLFAVSLMDPNIYKALDVCLKERIDLCFEALAMSPAFPVSITNIDTRKQITQLAYDPERPVLHKLMTRLFKEDVFEGFSDDNIQELYDHRDEISLKEERLAQLRMRIIEKMASFSPILSVATNKFVRSLTYFPWTTKLLDKIEAATSTIFPDKKEASLLLNGTLRAFDEMDPLAPQL